MKMDEYKSSKFLRLKLEWYDILKESGFEDLESPRGHLKADIDKRTLNQSMIDKVQREEYYAQALAHLDVIAEKDSRDWQIWLYHCDGQSTRAIAELTQTHPATVQFRIKKMRIKANLG